MTKEQRNASRGDAEEGKPELSPKDAFAFALANVDVDANGDSMPATRDSKTLRYEQNQSTERSVPAATLGSSLAPVTTFLQLSSTKF
ncbi:GL12294 [Drosophila persimilis]|uniref:GL12294 n=1 Tax=Drosophila persimilis TaxID=7234 RepID=B4GM89_DROPE|nr:GL12294 [Drosophila persimilis]